MILKIRNKETKYDSSKNAYITEEVIRDKEVFTKEESESKNEVIKNLVLYNKEPEAGQSVYFMKGVIFSRKMFKETYPDVKIVRNIKDADIIIVDNNINKGLYFSTCSVIKNDDDTYSYDWKDPNKITHYRLWRVSKFERELIDNLDLIKTKNLLQVCNLKMKGTVTAENTKETLEYINILFNGDSSSVNLAMRMLMEIDYEEYKMEILLLLSSKWNNWLRSEKKISVELKSFLNKFKADFPSFTAISENTKTWIRTITSYCQTKIDKGETNIVKIVNSIL